MRVTFSVVGRLTFETNLILSRKKRKPFAAHVRFGRRIARLSRVEDYAELLHIYYALGRHDRVDTRRRSPQKIFASHVRFGGHNARLISGDLL